MKSKHWNGDWNIPEFYAKVFDECDCQIEIIVFHPVWHDSPAPKCDIDERQKVATEITKMYDDMYREEFFDNFFSVGEEMQHFEEKWAGRDAIPPKVLGRVAPNFRR